MIETINASSFVFFLFGLVTIGALVFILERMFTKWLGKKRFYPISLLDSVEIIPEKTFFLPAKGMWARLGHEFSIKRHDGSTVVLVGDLWLFVKPLWVVKEYFPPKEKEDDPPHPENVLPFRRKEKNY
jgi:hypothetical protein